MRVSKLAVGVTAVAGVLSLGVAAFALDGSSDTGTVTDPTVTTGAPGVTTTTAAPGTTDPTDPPGTSDPTGTSGTTEPTTGVSTVGCPEGQTFANHGAYVSSVTHDPNRAPGDQAAAAQSDCGKPLASTEPDSIPDSTPDSTEPTDTGPTDTGPTDTGPGGQAGAPGNSGNAPGHNR